MEMCSVLPSTRVPRSAQETPITSFIVEGTSGDVRKKHLSLYFIIGLFK